MQGPKRASVKDIASRLHISLSTVHKALTGKPGISESRRRQVIETAEEMGYVVNTVAQTLSRRSMNIGVILPSMWQEYFLQLKNGIEKQIDSMQEYKVIGIYYVIPASPSVSEAEKIKTWLLNNRIEAVLYCASNYVINNVARQALASSECPVFWIGGSTDVALSVSNITIDAELTGKIAADFICCTAASGIKAAVFTGSMKTDIHKAKTDAFCHRMRENGAEVLAVYETEDDPERAYIAVDKLLKTHSDVNAVYVSTSTSEPICRYLEENHLAGRITLLGTDLFDILKDYMKKGIMKATISQNQEEVGRLAAVSVYEYLHKMNTYGNADWKPERLILVKPTLLLRANIE